jgi:hypothetical protein
MTPTTTFTANAAAVMAVSVSQRIGSVTNLVNGSKISNPTPLRDIQQSSVKAMPKVPGVRYGGVSLADWQRRPICR